jgi:putative CocE/NonD family hydrolase
MEGPAVRAFLMGANRWLDLDSWPPTGITYRPIYLRQQHALSFETPDSSETPDRVVYDPRQPVPSQVLYPQLGPKDYGPIEHQVLCYTTDVLPTDLNVVGPVTAVLYASSSARDTDWVVRLCDVQPDGRSLSVCDGILRARYRDSLSRPTLLNPDQVYEFRVDLWSTAQVFKAGHRLRVHVTSSDFPRYDRNLNTGGPPGAESESVIAVNHVFHDATRPSHLLLPQLR